MQVCPLQIRSPQVGPRKYRTFAQRR
jgi:hypothetical protein